MPRRIRGTVVSTVGTGASAFQISSVATVFGGKAPSSPVTVQQIYAQGYQAGQLMEAIFNETSGQWHNLPAPIKLGCHLDVTTSGFIFVTPQSLAGSGLGVSFGTGPNGCDQLTATGGGSLTAGCGINIVSNVVSVDPTDLAGDGLVADDTTCALHVNTGCGLEIVDDKVQVNPAEIAGKGLREASGSTCDQLELALGCGLEFDAADKVAVKASDLAGAGLAPAAAGCGLDVQVDCGLEIVADTVRVKASDLAGEGLVVGENCKLDVNLGVGCGLDFDNLTDTIFFDAPTVAGSGLAVEGTCSLRVNTGCGLNVVGDVVVVDPLDLAGDGLVPQGTGCALKVNTGCGLEIAADAVKVKTSDLVGNGLEAVGGSGQCAMQVKLGLGLEFSATQQVALHDTGFNAGTVQLYGHVNGAFQFKTLAEWLKLLPGYVHGNDQSVGHDAGLDPDMQDDVECS